MAIFQAGQKYEYFSGYIFENSYGHLWVAISKKKTERNSGERETKLGWACPGSPLLTEFTINRSYHKRWCYLIIVYK